MKLFWLAWPTSYRWYVFSHVSLCHADNLQQPPPTTQRRLGTVRGRREARNSFVPPTQQISESAPSPAEQPNAVPTEASPSAAATSTAQPVPEPTEREIPPIEQQAQATNSQFTQSPMQTFASPTQSFASPAATAAAFSPSTPGMDQASPFRPTSRAATGSLDHGADTQSIRSGRSLGSTTSQGLKHPELHDTGLSSSIVETVSARFENGQLKTSSLIGEIAMAFNPADFSTPFGSDNIRLENFGMLEKVAPNPAFISQASGKDGEYSVNLSNLSKTQIAFKYQVRLDEPGTQAPLLVAPAYKIQPTQSDVIVAYSLNPAFALHGRQSVTLSNVMLALTLEGAKATACLSKPVGSFHREKNLIYWQLGDLTLTPGAAPTRLLARFNTESEASTGHVECRWEISGEHAQGLGSGLSVSMQSQGGGADGSDPFADEEGASGLTAVWKGVRTVKKLTSGIYSAK